MFKKALVTGASGGLGNAICKKLASEGVALVICGRDDQKLQALVFELKGEVPIEVCVQDLNSPRERKRIIEKIHNEAIDLVINNAGFGLYGPVFDHSVAEQMAIFEVNATAALEITLEAVQGFIKGKRRGVILNVASAAGYLCFPNLAVYSAAKAAMISYSTAIDQEVKEMGVRVLCACPGQILTEFRSRAARKPSHDDAKTSMTPEYAANAIWNQIETRKSLNTFSFRYRLGIFIAQHLPKCIVSRALASSIQKRLE